MKNISIENYNSLDWTKGYDGSLVGFLTSPKRNGGYDMILIISNGELNNYLIKFTNIPLSFIMPSGIKGDFLVSRIRKLNEKHYENNLWQFDFGFDDSFRIIATKIEVYEIGVIDWESPENKNRRISEFEYLLYENPIDDNLE